MLINTSKLILSFQISMCLVSLIFANVLDIWGCSTIVTLSIFLCQFFWNVRTVLFTCVLSAFWRLVRFHLAGSSYKNLQSSVSVDQEHRKWDFLVRSESFLMVMFPIFASLRVFYFSFWTFLFSNSFNKLWPHFCRPSIFVVLYLYLGNECQL